jgi:DMSO/TMAO reductase YedYZ molybdopterin-dependent catalytic subunit
VNLREAGPDSDNVSVESTPPERELDTTVAGRAPRTTPIGRRVILGMAALGAAGIVFGETVQRGVARALSVVNPGGGGLASLLPGADNFRIYTVTGSYPTQAVASYELKVSGLVDKPLSLSFSDLEALPPVRFTKDFQCVTGWRVPNVHWVGVKLSDVLDAAGTSPSASSVLFGSFDGVYTESLSMVQARRPDVIVAYEMVGQRPISNEHGGPVRLYVAPMYGYKSIKWLSSITVSDKIVPGYWEQNGYDVDAWIGHSNPQYVGGRNDQPVDN